MLFGLLEVPDKPFECAPVALCEGFEATERRFVMKWMSGRVASAMYRTSLSMFWYTLVILVWKYHFLCALEA